MPTANFFTWWPIGPYGSDGDGNCWCKTAKGDNIENDVTARGNATSGAVNRHGPCGTGKVKGCVRCGCTYSFIPLW